MAKERLHDLPQMKGAFNVTGVVNGVQRQTFYTEKQTKNGKDFRMVNFGVEYDEYKTVFMNLNGMPTDSVYFSKRNKDGKVVTKAVDWKNRLKKDPDGYEIIGVTLGITKTTNDKGNLVNDKKVLSPYDACGHISENLMDDSSVYVGGNIDFSSYMDSEGNLRRSVKYIPNRMYLAQDVDFDKFAELDKKEQNKKHSFRQRILYMGIEPEVIDEKTTDRFILSAKIVTYNDIVDAEFIVTTKARALWFKKNMKPYQAIDVSGIIEVAHELKEKEENNNDPFDEDPTKPSVKNQSKTELVIIARDETTIDTETYTEKDVTEAIKKINAARTAEKKFDGDSKKTSKKATVEEEDDGGFEDMFDEDEDWLN